MKQSSANEVAETLKGFYESHVTALNGILDKLPAPLKAELTGLKDSLNEQLAKLKPIDQVPAAQEASCALNYLTNAVVHMQEYATSMMERLKKLAGEMEAKSTALNGLEARVTGGELLDKTKVKELTDAAFAQGADSLKPALRAMRVDALALCGLPAAPDDVLDLPADKFTAAMTQAKTNVKKLGDDFGFAMNGAGKTFVAEMAYMDATAFQSRHNAIKESLPAKPAGGGGDPLLGGGGGGTGVKTKFRIG